MTKKNKVILLIAAILVIIAVSIGIGYAFFTFTRSGTNGEVVLGNIWMKYAENNGISLTNALPGDDYSKYFEFTITGKNTYEEKDIWYDIAITKGDIPDDKTEDNRIEDKYLKFKLVEVNGSAETEILKDKTYDDLTNKVIHVGTIPKSTNNFSKTYRLYMVISENLTFGDSSEAILTLSEFENLFGSIKVKVTGDFTEKEVSKSGAEAVIENVATYAVASASDFEGGLVGVNTSGSLYNETANEEIREYRYTGPTVNNYAYFNCKDTDGAYNYGDDDYNYAGNCETWRIVGIFKNANDEWSLKLMRNTMLTADEIPETYIIDGTTYTVADSETSIKAYWNKPDRLKSTNYNDWTSAGLRYFLNTTSDTNGTPGYYGSLTSKTKELIDGNYIYYLGDFEYNADTTIAGYQNERDTTKIWSGAVGLLYPSDFGYSALSSNWNTELLSSYDGAANETSWMQKTANHTENEWLLSPSSFGTNIAMRWNSAGYLDHNYVNERASVRPVLNLKSSVKVKTGEGSTNSPYVFVGE